MGKVLSRTWSVAVLFAGTLAYFIAIAGVVLFGLIWEGCSRLSAAVRSLFAGRPD